MPGRRSRALRRDCVNLQVWNGRRSRLERLIGIAEPVQALLSAALGLSAITVDVSGTVMRCHTRMARRCRSAARFRFAASCRRIVPPRSGQIGEVGRGGRAIASGAIVGRLAGTGVTVIEQPTTESKAVAAGAIGEEAVVADAVEVVR